MIGRHRRRRADRGVRADAETEAGDGRRREERHLVPGSCRCTEADAEVSGRSREEGVAAAPGRAAAPDPERHHPREPSRARTAPEWHPIAKSRAKHVALVAPCARGPCRTAAWRRAAGAKHDARRERGRARSTACDFRVSVGGEDPVRSGERGAPGRDVDQERGSPAEVEHVGRDRQSTQRPTGDRALEGPDPRAPGEGQLVPRERPGNRQRGARAPGEPRRTSCRSTVRRGWTAASTFAMDRRPGARAAVPGGRGPTTEPGGWGPLARGRSWGRAGPRPGAVRPCRSGVEPAGVTVSSPWTPGTPCDAGAPASARWPARRRGRQPRRRGPGAPRRRACRARAPRCGPAAAT